MVSLKHNSDCASSPTESVASVSTALDSLQPILTPQSCSTVASIINGPRMDKDYKIVARQVAEASVPSDKTVDAPKDHNDLAAFPIERARLRSLRMSSVVTLIFVS